MFENSSLTENFCGDLREGKGRCTGKSCMLRCTRSVPVQFNTTSCFSAFLAISIMPTTELGLFEVDDR